MRQTPIPVHPYPTLKVGDKVEFADMRQRWTVRAVTARGRFVILTKPFNARRTVLYTVVDFDRGVRGRDDHYGIGYETPEDIDRALRSFQFTEDGRRYTDEDDETSVVPVEVSHRSNGHVRLDFESINGQACDNFGRVIV